MNDLEFKKLVAGIETGKTLPDSIYLHKSALSDLDMTLVQLIATIERILKIESNNWDVVKLYRRHYKMSLLSYPTFEHYPYPELAKSHTIDLQQVKVREADYAKSQNPPILHRRETFVLPDHPKFEEFALFTQEGLDIGLYDNTRTIGFKNGWTKAIASQGYCLDKDGHLLKKHDAPISTTDDSTEIKIQRHRTAIERNQLSQPMKILARHGYLDGMHSVFDYGCGRGDDLRELEAHGLDAKGWDPNFFPESSIEPAEIVNLGFVLNVIEDRAERDLTLLDAWALADSVLVVSVMVAGESLISQFRPFKDGVVTSTNTFQKYYAQSEVKLYLETLLNTNAIAVGTGIFFIFKNPVTEQDFLLQRQKVLRPWTYKTIKARTNSGKKITQSKFTENSSLFTAFWTANLDLGRVPANDEFDLSEEVRALVGSHASAHIALKEYFDASEFEAARQNRKDDLLVYFALGLFEKRRPYTKFPLSLQRDIKAFFKSHSNALDHAQALLFSISDTALIERECISSFQRLETGFIDEGHSYTIHKTLNNHLSPTLRTYIGCATTLYGNLEDVDLIKIHMTSGKVTFLEYDDWSKKAPILKYRIKVRMRDQDFDIFEHTNSEQTILNKAIYGSRVER
jgi:DNA phosphorothioation-associated putative methyltransferase